MDIFAIFSNKKTLYYIAEPLIFIAALMLINLNFFRDDIGFLGFALHPFWLIIFFLSPRQRFPFGFISAVIVALSYILTAYARSNAAFSQFITSSAGIRTPILFILAGYYLSLIRENFDHENRVLLEKNSLLEKHIESMNEVNEGISEDDRKSALKIFETSNTIKTVYQAASSLGSFNEDELMRSLVQLVLKFTDSESFAIYKMIEDNKLIIVEEYVGENSKKSTIPQIGNVSDDPVVAEANSTGKIFTLIDIYDTKPKHIARSDVKIACPISFKDTSELYGFIVIFDIPFSRMNLETINILELVANWTQSALVKSRQMVEMKSKSIEDELTLAYKYDYFKKRISEEHSRAQRYNFDLSTLLVKITNYESMDEDKKPEIIRLFSIFVKTIVRDVDIVSRFKDENFLMVLLPSTDEKGLMILIKRLRQALPDFLKNASLPPNAIAMDFNFKVLYRRK